jgi:hypothetical protein
MVLMGRSLRPVFTRQMAGKLFHRFSNIVASTEENIRGLAIEILETLHSMVFS